MGSTPIRDSLQRVSKRLIERGGGNRTYFEISLGLAANKLPKENHLPYP